MATGTAGAQRAATARTYYASLDGVRAFAVMFVVVAHASIRLFTPATRIRSGDVGVQLFFALSGFLITALLLKEQERHGTIDLRAFFVRRGLRIWPLYYAVLLLYTFVLPHIDMSVFSGVYASIGSDAYPAYRDNLWSHYLFLQNYVTSATEMRLGLGVFWSLAVEEHFYLAWPLIVRFAPRRRLPQVLSAIIALSALSSIVGLGSGHETHNEMVAIGLGCAVGLVSVRHPALFERLHARMAVSVGGATLLYAYLVGFKMLDLSFPGPSWTKGLVVPIASALLVAGLVRRGPDDGDPVLSHPLTVFVGRVSFGIYLTHALVIGFLARFMRSWSQSALGGPVAVAIVSAASIAVAGLVYTFFERPILRQKKRFQRV